MILILILSSVYGLPLYILIKEERKKLSNVQTRNVIDGYRWQGGGRVEEEIKRMFNF